MERDVSPRQPEAPDPGPGRPARRKRTGSRLLLAVSLAAGIFGAFLAGATIADFLSDIAGVTSTAVRLGVKVACIAAFLPVGLYLVERVFLSRSSRTDNKH